MTVEDRLFERGFRFNFFQAVRLLQRLGQRHNPPRSPVGRKDGLPALEAVRFRAHQSLSFPPSSIYEIVRAGSKQPPAMSVWFMGLTGIHGELPRHYTELVLRLARDEDGPEQYLLREWFDLFNHRFIALFYRAWEKYRFYVPFERGEAGDPEHPDPFTRCLLSLLGLEPAPLRNRLHVSCRRRQGPRVWGEVLARVNDLALLRYSGLLAPRRRTAVGLELLLRDYFQVPVRVKQFQGQWLRLEPATRSRAGGAASDTRLGVNLVAGDRVWDIENKIRICLGPLRYAQFLELLPDRAAIPERKAFFLLSHLVRLYVGPGLDFDIQLVLRAEDVPQWRMGGTNGTAARLGWNTWASSRTPARDADTVVIEGKQLVWLEAAAPPPPPTSRTAAMPRRGGAGPEGG